LKDLEKLERQHDEVLNGLAGKTIKKNTRNFLAEQFTTSLTILWEKFLDEILLSYLQKSHKQYLSALETEMRKTVVSFAANPLILCSMAP
jgi:hypothetical protein